MLNSASDTRVETVSILKISGAPGTGKTRALAKEAIRLVKAEGIPPEAIQVLTLTETHRKRMSVYLEREGGLADVAHGNISVETFEEFCKNLLSLHADRIRLSADGARLRHDFRLLSDLQARLILRQIAASVVPANDPLHHPAQSLSFASDLYDVLNRVGLERVASDDAIPGISPEREPLVRAIARQFLIRTREKSLLTYRDLTGLCLRLLKENPEVSEHLRGRIRAFLVDEAQELSTEHYKLLRHFQGKARLVLAGCGEMSVRSSRGAVPETFKEPATILGESVLSTSELTQIHRGNAPLLRLASRWMGTLNAPDFAPGLEAPTPEALDNQLKFGFFKTSEEETRNLAENLKAHVAGETRVRDGVTGEERPAQWSDVAILCRSESLKTLLIDTLTAQGVPVSARDWPESIFQVKRFVYDALRVLEALERLDVPPTLENLSRVLADCPLRKVEKMEAVLLCNRHVVGWLGGLPEFERGLESLGLPDAPPGDALYLETIPKNYKASFEAKRYFQDFLRQLKALYAGYLAERNLGTLVWRLLEQGRFLERLAVPAEDASGETQRAMRAISGFLRTLAQLDEHTRDALGHALPLGHVLEVYDALWRGGDNQRTGNAVHILSIAQAQGEEYPFVWVPFLTADEFPKEERRSALLTDEASGTASRVGEEARLLALAMSRASHTLYMSAHQSHNQMPAFPSPFLKALIHLKRQGFGEEVKPESLQTPICWCETSDKPPANAKGDCGISFCSFQNTLATLTEAPRQATSSFQGSSPWSRLERQAPEPIFSEEEILTLSPTSLKNYMDCPRRFFYRNVLRLPEEGNRAADMGTLIHRLMEVFNQRFNPTTQPATYTVESLRALAEKLFRFSETREELIEEYGFKAEDLENLARLDAMALHDLKTRALDSIEDLVAKGYFRQPIRRVIPEKAFEFSLDGVERCKVSARIDALLELEDGGWSIVDYKFYNPDSFAVGKESGLTSRMVNVLSPLPEDAPSHAERFKTSESAPRLYQLPLYYLAAQTDPEFAGKVKELALQIIRPQFHTNPEQGAVKVRFPLDELERGLPDLLADMGKHIVNPILGSGTFETIASRSCGNCAFLKICDVSDSEEFAEGSLAE